MPRTIVYVSCAAEAQIVRFALDNATGALTLLDRTTVPGPVDPPSAGMALALTPDHTRMYAGCRNPPYPVTGFAIGADGALRPLGSGHLAGSMSYLATDRTGRFLFGASYYQAVLSVTAIGADGVPGEPLQVLETPPKAHSVLPDPENRAVYAGVLGGDIILRQQFDPATGRLATPLAPVAHTAPGAGPRHLRFARGGTLLYCTNELDGTLNAYARDTATGGLTELQSVRLTPPAAPGKTLAAADLQLTPDEPEARGFAIDPRGRWLVCAGQHTGCVAVYAIDPVRGVLTRLAAYPAGGNANWVEIIDRPA